MPNKLEISRLGSCSELWHSLTRNEEAQCTFGGFPVNLRTLKSEAQDTAVLTATVKTFLDRFCTIEDPSKNRLGLSVGELYEINADVNVIVDPLPIDTLLWRNLENSATRMDQFSDIASTEELARLEIQVLLFGNAELQRKLSSELNELQEKYTRGWVHFHGRIEAFWLVAAKVCLNREPEANLYTPSQAEWLDWLFFSNSQNKKDYLQYIYNVYEVEKPDGQSISDKLNLIRKKLTILCRHIQKQNKEDDQAQWDGKLVSHARNIYTLWADLWATNNIRAEFDCPIGKQFVRAMDSLDILILGENAKSNLLVMLKGFSHQEQIEAIAKLRKLLANATKEWNDLLSQIEPDEKETIGAETPATFPDSGEKSADQLAQAIEDINIAISKWDAKIKDLEVKQQEVSSQRQESTKELTSVSERLTYGRELADFALKEYIKQVILKNISEKNSVITSNAGVPLIENTANSKKK